MCYEFTVSVPKVPGKITYQKRGGSTYVYYEYGHVPKRVKKKQDMRLQMWYTGVDIPTVDHRKEDIMSCTTYYTSLYGRCK